MSKTKSFWDKVCEFCCSNRESNKARTGRDIGREKDDRKHKEDDLPPQDLDQEYTRGQPPGGPSIFKDVEPVVEPLGEDSSSDEEE